MIDLSVSVDEQLVEADAAIVDNSAMAFDWLVTGKPLVVTIPRPNPPVRESTTASCRRATG